MGGMRLAALLLLAAVQTGCGHSVVAVSSGAPPSAVTPPGTASITTNSTAAALGLVLTIGVIDYVNNPQPFPSPAALFSPSPSPAPELAPERRISEQDCSKPVDLTAGNLRCK